MRFPSLAAIEAALPHAFLSVGTRATWCRHHGFDLYALERWMNKRGAAPKYEKMCRLIEAIEASGVRFQGDRFFVVPKPAD